MNEKPTNFKIIDVDDQTGRLLDNDFQRIQMFRAQIKSLGDEINKNIKHAENVIVSKYPDLENYYLEYDPDHHQIYAIKETSSTLKFKKK